jgi:hypothetical protein
MAKAKFVPIAEGKRWMPYMVLGILASWLGLWGVLRLPINATTKVLFFIALYCAVTTTVMPAAAYLNARFGRCAERRVYQARFIRQSIWVGLYTGIIAWLQMQRVLNLMLALILIAAFALIETFLITREGPAEEG